jgi:hypothetical protein
VTGTGAPKAITAMDRKLACLFYLLIKHGRQYVDKRLEYYEARLSRTADLITDQTGKEACFSISCPTGDLMVSGELFPALSGWMLAIESSHLPREL